MASSRSRLLDHKGTVKVTFAQCVQTNETGLATGFIYHVAA